MALKDGIRGLFKDISLGAEGKRLMDRLEKSFEDEEEAGLLNQLLDQVEERGGGGAGNGKGKGK